MRETSSTTISVNALLPALEQLWVDWQRVSCPAKMKDDCWQLRKTALLLDELSSSICWASMMFIWMIAAATGPAVSAKDNNEQTLHDCRVLCVLMLLYLFPSDMLIDFNVIRKETKYLLHSGKELKMIICSPSSILNACTQKVNSSIFTPVLFLFVFWFVI